MNVRAVGIAIIISFAISFACTDVASQAQSTAPNIIHIFADDLGYGSVGFNGQTRIQTPNLDAMASAGLRFNAAYAATLCSPSRAMLMTGFHNGHTSNDRNSNIAAGIRAQDVTVAEVLGPAGFSTAVFGKWGWGGSDPGGGSLRPNPVIQTPATLPNNQGFDEFYGYLNHGRAHSYLVDSLWETDTSAADGLSLSPTGNTAANPTASYTHDLIAARSVDFIEQHAGDADPFYMQVNYTIPHFDVDAIASFGLGPYENEPWSQKQKNYAAMITRMDASIGDIVAKVQDPNGDRDPSDSIAGNTLIVFTSDNGASAEDGSPISFFDAAGIYRGGKRDLYEGGIRMPTVAMWPGTIAAGTETDVPTDLADFLPTAAELAGIQGPVGLDGVSIAPLLTGEGILRDRKYLIFEHHEGDGPDSDSRDARWTIVRGNDKLIKFSNGDLELFDLSHDPGETDPLDLSHPDNAALRDDLQAIALAEGVEREDAYAVEFASWNAGNSGGNTHFNGVSLTAAFRSAPFVPIRPAGVLTLDGDYQQLATGILEIELGGVTHGIDYDVLEVDGDVALDGSLRVTLVNPGDGMFQPMLGDTFEIVTATADVTGRFSVTDLQPLGGGLRWQIDYGTHAVAISVVPAADGDFNVDGAFDCADVDALVAEIANSGDDLAFDMTGDGHVDTQDLSAWLAAAGAANLASGNPYLTGDANLDGVVDTSDFNLWNSHKFTTAAAWCRGDFTADGVVDASDFNVWNANKFSSSDATVAVPEPTFGGGMAAVLCGALPILSRRRGRRIGATGKSAVEIAAGERVAGEGDFLQHGNWVNARYCSCGERQEVRSPRK